MMPVSARFLAGWPLSYRSRWLYWLALPVLVPTYSYFLVGARYWQQPGAFLGTTLVVGVLTTAWFLGLDWATGLVVRRFPELPQTRPRVLLTALACSLLSALYLTATAGLFGYFGLFGAHYTVADIATGTGILPEVRAALAELTGLELSSQLVTALLYLGDFVVILLLAIVYEVFYSLNRWRQSQLNMEQLRKASLQGQMQSLKNQINPHFLFNTLNSLSSLIADEPARAELFVDEIAKVYRYLLNTSEQELTPLAVELDFIQSYYHLLKTRYGAGLELHVRVGEAYLAHQLPPLTLQMLVENAVKHNAILTEEPLHIQIATTSAGQLRVSNNVQQKTTRVDSNHVGLPNITARYQLLAQPVPVIEAGPEQFVVLLPLIP